MLRTTITTLIAVFITVNSFAHSVIIVDVDKSEYLKLNQSKLSVSINNQIATVSSTQVFKNQFSEDREGKYAFPLPLDANPISFRYRVNGADWQIAGISTDNQNSDLPGSGSSGGSGGTGGGGGSTATGPLASYLGDQPMFFGFQNILPAQAIIEVEIIYVQLLSYEFGIVDFNYPADYSLIQSAPLDLFEATLELYSDRSITNFEVSNSNSTQLLDTNYGNLSFLEEDFLADSNLTANYELASDELGNYTLSTYVSDSTFQCDDKGNGFLTMIIEPESNDLTQVIQKNFVLVIDESGSMGVSKMNQAKDAAKFIANNLNSEDKFNIISFDSDINIYQPSLIEVDNNSVTDAITYIDNINSGGGTNISSSLENAIQQFESTDSTVANIIIFFTDGKATAGIEDTPGIINHISETVNETETKISIFTFGIGNNVTKDLLTAIAVENNGLVEFLEDKDLEEEITSFFLKINNPVLLNTQIQFSPDVIDEIYPTNLQNLYKGQQMIVSGRYQEAVPTTMTLSGNFYNSDIEYIFPINLSDTLNPEYSIIPRIWAKQKLDQLTIQYNLSTGTDASLIQSEIDQISQCFGVVSVGFNSFEDTALEIELHDFKIYSVDDQTVNVEWITVSELNNDRFEVERSADGENWETIHSTEGKMVSNERVEYSYVDHHPLEGINYYRIVSYDLDGRKTYSYINAINLKLKQDIAVFPNPVSNGEYMFINAKEQMDYDLNIYSADGRLIQTTQFFQNGSVQIEGYNKGLYLCVLSGLNYNEIIPIVIE